MPDTAAQLSMGSRRDRTLIRLSLSEHTLYRGPTSRGRLIDGRWRWPTLGNLGTLFVLERKGRLISERLTAIVLDLSTSRSPIGGGLERTLILRRVISGGDWIRFMQH